MPKADQPLPDAVVVELHRAWVPHDAALVVLENFGPLPLEGKIDLINRLIAARLIYSLRLTIHPPKHLRHRASSQVVPTRAQEKRRLEDIQKSAKRLLKLLGIDDPAVVAVEPFQKGMGILHSVTTAWLLTSLPRIASERRGDKATLGAIERLSTLLLLLSDLVEAAGQSAEQVNQHIVTKTSRLVNANGAILPKTGRSARGGSRREGETAESWLVRDLLETYFAIRDRYPDSGPAPSCDEKLRGFVRAGLKFSVAVKPIISSKGEKFELVDMKAVDSGMLDRITDKAIRGIFDRQSAQTRVKTARS